MRENVKEVAFKAPSVKEIKERYACMHEKNPF